MAVQVVLYHCQYPGFPMPPYLQPNLPPLSPENTPLTRMLAHAQSENFLGNVQPALLSYRSFASANGQSLRGSWVSVNQLAAPYTTWREQGDVIEIVDKEYGIFERLQRAYIRVQHPMFRENRAPGPHASTSATLYKVADEGVGVETEHSAIVSTQEATAPSIYADHPEWDPESHFRRAIPSTAVQREFQYWMDINA
ncbi:uncharacterized protein EI90DRAFT_3016010 [Cantharellus anzutake]|uniref:uncharacterized protein n=1 Tax=Cantharellus anzutake TaxID=1750568 RepID=UPI0019067C80|nr:uncharacterized protein EI90DRAFT_3016010 [Cantharellus anzutake]KAF8331864.1 hypothetical protein EI90DRAFT_3016010 [Cantharellus anzutake]